MACHYREGEKVCTWWTLGQCLNPQTPKLIKDGCNGRLPKYKTAGITQQNLDQQEASK
jgi:hypothetical protein